jgi:hypothetical protein
MASFLGIQIQFVTPQKADEIRRTASKHLMRVHGGIGIHSVEKDGVNYILDVVNVEQAKRRLEKLGKLKP